MSNDSELARLQRLPGQLWGASRKLVRDIAAQQLRDVRTRTSGRPGLVPRTGEFRKSFRVDFRDDLKRPEAIVYTEGTAHRTRSGKPFSHVQEGVPPGTDVKLKPSSSRTLAVPLSRTNPEAYYGLDNGELWPRVQAAGLTRFAKINGQWFVFLEGEDEPKWVLKKFVKVPARLEFQASFDKRRPQREAAINAAVENVLRAN